MAVSGSSEANWWASDWRLGELKLANGDITIIPAAPGFDLVSSDEERLFFTPIVAWQFEEGFGAPNHKYFHLALPVTIEDGTVTEGTMVVRYPNGQLVALHDMPLDTEEEALAYLRRKERERRGRGLSLRAA